MASEACENAGGAAAEGVAVGAHRWPALDVQGGGREGGAVRARPALEPVEPYAAESARELEGEKLAGGGDCVGVVQGAAEAGALQGTGGLLGRWVRSSIWSGGGAQQQQQEQEQGKQERQGWGRPWGTGAAAAAAAATAWGTHA